MERNAPDIERNEAQQTELSVDAKSQSREPALGGQKGVEAWSSDSTRRPGHFWRCADKH